jgi:hypothetical protein
VDPVSARDQTNYWPSLINDGTDPNAPALPCATLAMLAVAYLAATRAREAKKGGSGTSRSADDSGLISLSSNEIRRLLAALVLAPITCLTSTITWSNWRRRRQHQVRR